MVKSFFKILEPENNCFAFYYQGKFTDDLPLKVITDTKPKLLKNRDTYRFHQKISFISIECLQNVIRHAVKAKEMESYNSKFLIQKTNDRITIITGNLMENSEVEDLKERIEELKKLSKKDLSFRYKIQLEKGSMTKRGGAGLGLISIIKRTDCCVKYKFFKINDQYTYFYFQSTILIKKNQTQNNCSQYSIDNISDIKELAVKENAI